MAVAVWLNDAGTSLGLYTQYRHWCECEQTADRKQPAAPGIDYTFYKPEFYKHEEEREGCFVYKLLNKLSSYKVGCL